ncbi:MerR family transcriptional regulator [Niabella aurantiaca]|uniref:MerR family transcriptional regulator n=1 Tax=Niabella aurantiaca TaxID=379900 RepID=UPI0003697055|nr:MerR family transcriptional regulator [Niabella aurantiaca]
MKQLSVKELARAAGVTVRTLHLYDRTGLLKPALRTEKKYRYYGKAELLRLQQILFYKELGLSLAEIAALLDAPDFDLVKALTGHKKALQQKQQQLSKMMETIDKTILNLKGKINMTHEELYAGLPREQAQQWRKEALEKWPDQVKHSEKMLLKMSRAGFDILQQTFKSVNEQLAALKKEDPQSPQSPQVQQHYDCILKFWGKTDNIAAAYKGLGDLYVADTRYTTVNGTADREFAAFMNAAMIHFADTQLKN